MKYLVKDVQKEESNRFNILVETMQKHVGEKITIISTNGMGFPQQIHLLLDEIEVSKYAQYEKCITLIGKIKKMRMTSQRYEFKFYGYKLQDLVIYKDFVTLENKTPYTESNTGLQVATYYSSVDKLVSNNNTTNLVEIINFKKSNFNSNWENLLEATQVVEADKDGNFKTYTYNTFEEAKQNHSFITSRKQAMKDCFNYETEKEYCLRFENSHAYDILSY